LFRDGLHAVFAFLELSELNAATQSCRYWNSAAVSCPSIGARFPADSSMLPVPAWKALIDGQVHGTKTAKHIGAE
jgi:hypothetical protein